MKYIETLSAEHGPGEEQSNRDRYNETLKNLGWTPISYNEHEKEISLILPRVTIVGRMIWRRVL